MRHTMAKTAVVFRVSFSSPLAVPGRGALETLKAPAQLRFRPYWKGRMLHTSLLMNGTERMRVWTAARKKFPLPTCTTKRSGAFTESIPRLKPARPCASNHDFMFISLMWCTGSLFLLRFYCLENELRMIELDS